MVELKACPFCGGTSCYVDFDGMAVDESGNAACELNSCMPRESHVPVVSWNTRPIEDALTAENARLREKVERAFFDGIIFCSSGKHCGGTTGALKEAKEYSRAALEVK